VPVVKYDENIIFESRAILRYIAKNNIDYKDLILKNNITPFSLNNGTLI